MALIDCPECTNKISDKADACPSCGYPIAKLKLAKPKVKKRKVKSVETIDPRFPNVPEIMGVGKRLSFFTPEFNFRGEIGYDDMMNFDFSLPCKVELSICQFGLIISEIIENKSALDPIVLKLHFSLIISLKNANLLQAQLHKSAKKPDIPLEDMLFCDSFTFVEEPIKRRLNKKDWENTPILVINYWNKEQKFPTTLVVRGSESKILKFINSYNTAKSNYVRGIPNIPDKKGDNKYLITLGVIIIITCIVVYFFMSAIT